MHWIEETRQKKEQVKDPETRICLRFSGSSRKLPKLKPNDLDEGGKVGGKARQDNEIY